MDLIEWDRTELPIKIQAHLLSLNRTSLYYKQLSPAPEEVRIKHAIDRIYTQYPFYGSRRITAALLSEGLIINRKATQRHMREIGIEGIHPGPNLSRRDLKTRIYPYLLRGLLIAYPDQVWGIDITYIRLNSAWMYLVAIIDWFSRFVVAWELDQTLDVAFVIEAVQRAFTMARPEIFNSDQGSHFTSHDYINILKNEHIAISMDGKGRAIDNIFTERFFRSLKYEEVYPKEYATPREARNGIKSYIEFYNYKRFHQSLSYQTPAQLYYSLQ